MKINSAISTAPEKRGCISVVLNCYNEEEYVSEAIESILNQSAIDQISEIIVVDDGSQDDTPNILSSYAQSNKKIKIITQNNYGLACARNTGVKHSCSPWVAFLDGDDVWGTTKIEQQLKKIEENPEADLIYGDSFSFTERSSTLKRTHSFADLGKHQTHYYFLLGGAIVPSSVILRKSCFYNSGGFDERFLNCQDTELWLRLLPCCNFLYLSEPIFYRRLHNSSISSNAVRKIKYQLILCNVAPEKNKELAYLKKSRESVFLMAQAIEIGKTGNLKTALICAGKSFLKSPLWCWFYVIPCGRRFYRNLLAKLKIGGLTWVTYKARQKAHGGRIARH